MLELFQMWALVELLGLLCLPLTVQVFGNLPDRGWAFSRALGVVILAFCVWLPLMCMPFLPFSQIAIATIAFILLLCSLVGFGKQKSKILKLARQNLLYILISEIIFLGMIFLLGWIRAHGPDIRGFEMYMDEGFITSIMRSPHLPPNDMWFAGYSINYYYYAQYVIAVLAKLLGQSPSIAFNTGICIYFGLCASNLFGITCNIVSWACRQRAKAKNRFLKGISVGSIPYGLMSMLLALIFGNLASTQAWWQYHGETLFEQLIPLPLRQFVHFSQDPNIDAYHAWFGPTRVIDFPNTINEFPAFSFLLSCFHAHVLTLAFTIMAIGLAFNLLLKPEGKGIGIFGRGWAIPLNLSCTALVLGGLFVMNGWDYPTYMGLTLLCIVGQQWFVHEHSFIPFLKNVLIAGGSLVALSIIFYLPFYLHFISPAQGIGLVSAQSRSALGGELFIYGLFIFVFLSLTVASIIKEPIPTQPHSEDIKENVAPPQIGDLSPESHRDQIYRVRAIYCAVRDWYVCNSFLDDIAFYLPLICVVIFFIACVLILHFMINSATFVITSSFALLGVILLLYHIQDRSLAFTLLLGSAAFALVAGCEIFFLRDAFAGGPDERMNTVFKFYFQAWILLSICCSAGLFFVREAFRSLKVSHPTLQKALLVLRGLWLFWLLGLIVASMVYPLTAPSERYDPGTYPPAYETGSLDGLAYLKNCSPLSCPSVQYPGDYAAADDYYAISWLNAHVQGDPVIVESTGWGDKIDYSLFGRVSIFTGLPTIMGWQGHEYQWRLNWLKNPANYTALEQRSSDIDQIYTSPDPKIVLSTMARYKAQYIYVGPLEAMKYPQSDLHRYAKFMTVVYNAKGVIIYKVR